MRIAEKEGRTAVRADHLLAGRDKLADGSTVTLWVTDPRANPGIRSRCFHLDLGSGGVGGCGGGPGNTVTLNELSGVMVGSVGSWPASVVRLSAGEVSADMAVVGGYFLVPSRVAVTATAGISITLLGVAVGRHAVVTWTPYD